MLSDASPTPRSPRTVTPAFWSRVARQRISRRRALFSAAGAAAAASLVGVTACDDDGADPRDEPPRLGGTLRYGTSVPFSYGLDPHLEQGGGLPAIARAYGYLFHVDPRDDSLILDHADSVEQPEPGVYVIRLGQRRFHSRSPANRRAVTGDDAVLSIRRYRDHPFVTSKWWHTKLLAAEGAADPTTIVVRATRPYAYTLHELGQINAGAILPREAIDSQLDLRAGVSGSGPMQITAGSTTAQARLERFDGYTPPAYVDAMEWRAFANDQDKAAAFRERLIDVLSARDRREASELATDGAGIVTEPSLSWTSIGWRVDRPPFNDERVRRAIDIAIDRQTLLRAAAASEGDIAGPVNPHLANGAWALPDEELLAAQRSDLDAEARIGEARALLEAAGVRDVAVELQVAASPELLDLASLVRNQVLPLGIGLTIASLPLPAWFFNFRGGNFQATLISHPPYETPDASLRLYHTGGTEGTGNVFGFSSPAIDWLVERSWAEEDRETRRATVLEAQRLMVEARPMVHLFSGFAYTVAREYVRDSGLDLPGSLGRYAYRQWLDLSVEGRAD
jgi:peptide/nickel transport system substrate-binding protein